MSIGCVSRIRPAFLEILLSRLFQSLGNICRVGMILISLCRPETGLGSSDL